ncbi:molybdopterin-guanine dinucleotide biosynthesis protein B [Sulfurimonas gotlandica GD1]|uniref:Molybdopterin-guanine dinucleotide biosynthesis protein B n=1 Tax=Sulfurimonas gotlandica (strain DSM 19862 / JCM 16533 / GD1) TaxID=929558 RepID=B6BJE8_SULGG|nr:molybdopterin-guanine dinucleotide biosynthesis protein B [Sulfurimonas gotlandica]EDZ62515.1 molybdopterin-guanine dinucleotide biosynthesis protein B [Sulfurimonas gotlandica GD1]EHP31194.1 molybdopterin-guanine dinucleotide biosynthesis protein B [Sulfurimonas gotlandica GD1]
MNKRLAVAFTGPSNSGKTTLILKVARKLIHEHSKRVAIIKHDPSDKARFDVEGKDSYKFSDTGAEVIVTSPTRTTYFSKQNKDLDEMIRLFNDFDILLVEGLKYLPLPRISIFRDTLDSDYFPYMNALAIDDSINTADYDVPSNVDILDLNNCEDVISWILKNAKEV